ncbi:hypothetical protein GBA52_005405 [Prunus armeniaca]|nr:hypothetical protein GBA52_005405 [Prunus armeniaca]
MENGIQNSTRDHISVVIVDGYIGLQALENTMRAKLCPDSSSWAAKAASSEFQRCSRDINQRHTNLILSQSLHFTTELVNNFSTWKM